MLKTTAGNRYRPSRCDAFVAAVRNGQRSRFAATFAGWLAAFQAKSGANAGVWAFPTNAVSLPRPVAGKRLVVAYVIHSMQVGGAERSIARLINALDHQRFAPLVICLTKSGPAADWIDSPDVPVIEIHKQSTFDRRALRRLAQVFLDHRVDVVHSHNWGTLLETSFARRRGRVAAHVHAERGSVLGAAEMRGLRMQLRGWVAGWAMRRCDAVVTNAHSVALRIEQRCGYPAERVRVIPNGVERPGEVLAPEGIASERLQLGIDPAAIVIGSVGRLVPVKGFDLAVRALATLLADGGNYHLLLVGDGPERIPLETLAKSLGVAGRVHFVGHRDDVARWLSLIDLYVNTSHSEGMSQSLVEALAAGCPVIATDVGDSAEVVGRPAECGCLVRAADLPAIVAAISWLADPERRKQLGRNAIERHQKLFSSDAMAKRYESLYRGILPASSKTPNAS